MLDASHLSTVKYMYKWGCLENTDPKTQTVRLSKNLENADLENTDLESVVGVLVEKLCPFILNRRKIISTQNKLEFHQVWYAYPLEN